MQQVEEVQTMWNHPSMKNCTYERSSVPVGEHSFTGELSFVHTNDNSLRQTVTPTTLTCFNVWYIDSLLGKRWKHNLFTNAICNQSRYFTNCSRWSYDPLYYSIDVHVKHKRQLKVLRNHQHSLGPPSVHAHISRIVRVILCGALRILQEPTFTRRF